MQIAIRLDDITADMDWKKFLRLKSIMDSCGVRPLIGIVPEPCDEKLHFEEPRKDFWEYVRRLRDDSGWTLAMHGLSHVYTTDKGGIFPLNHQSEFAGLSFEKQNEMLAKGREILRENGIETDIFMAPSHTYDRDTLKALKANGFTKMTDGFGKEPYIYDGITFYPISFDRKRSLKEKNGVTTFVIHSNTLNDKEFDYWEKLFSLQTILAYDDYLKLKPKTKTGAGKLAEYLMAAGKYTLVHLR